MLMKKIKLQHIYRVFVNSINVGDNLFDFFKKTKFLERYDVILINEGQFFKDLYKFVDYIVNSLHKKVYVCGLDGDFKRKNWFHTGYNSIM